MSKVVRAMARSEFSLADVSNKALVGGRLSILLAITILTAITINIIDVFIPDRIVHKAYSYKSEHQLCPLFFTDTPTRSIDDADPSVYKMKRIGGH